MARAIDAMATKAVAAIHCFRSSTRKRNSMRKNIMLEKRASRNRVQHSGDFVPHPQERIQRRE